MKNFWVIEGHLDGGLYLIPEDVPEEELEEIEDFCDKCGDHDSIIGKFSDWKQLKRQVTDDEGWYRYSDEYLQSVFEDDK